MNTVAPSSKQQKITALLIQNFTPAHLQVENESHLHDVPPNAETHFKVVLVSDHFEGMPLIMRHRTVMQLVMQDKTYKPHALSLHLFTSGEWASGQRPSDSPLCQRQHPT